jgi:hypothetical protein
MVKVAGSLEIDVALRMLGVGIARSVLDATVARERACRPFFVNRPRTLADLIVEGLTSCDNMMSQTWCVEGIVVLRLVWVCVGLQFTDAFHRWSAGTVSLMLATRRSGANAYLRCNPVELS